MKIIEHYFIQICDNSISMTFVINDQLFLTFIDQIKVNKLINDFSNEPLVRLK